MIRPTLGAITSLSISFAVAPAMATPVVLTDIAPVHSIVSAVMDGVGTADVLLTPENSPHHFSLKPSHLRKLSKADLFFYVGEELIPSFGKLETHLSPSAQSVYLLHAPQTVGRLMGSDTHDDHEEEDHSDHDAHDDHDHDSGHDEGEDHSDDHVDEHAEENDHAHEGVDPHAWLDPANAQVWATIVAKYLAERDPQNAAMYQKNADRLNAQIQEWDTQAKSELDTEHSAYIVLHDAYGYFSDHYGLNVRAAVFDQTGLGLSAGHLRDVETELAEGHISCLFTEPQLSDAPLKAFAHLNLNIVELDPLGTRATMGSGLYLELMEALKSAFVTCAGR